MPCGTLWTRVSEPDDALAARHDMAHAQNRRRDMVSIYAMCGGLIDLDRSGFFCDVAPGTRMTVPVICFLIGHPRGNVLVDTGVHRQALTDPVGRLGEGRASRFRLRSKPGDEVVSQLALLDLAP